MAEAKRGGRDAARVQSPRPSLNPELRLAMSGARFCALSAIPVVGVAWAVAGDAGLLGAGIAVLLVTALFFTQAAVLRLCAPRGGAALIVGSYLGFLSRLVATAGVLGLLQRVDGIHWPSLVIGAIVLMITVLVCESWHVSHTPALFWVNPGPVTARSRTHVERIRV